MLRNLLLLTFGTLAFMLGLAYVTTDTSHRDTPTTAAVVDLFDRLAFEGFGEAGPAGQGPFLRRWTQPVRIAVIGGPDAEAAPEEAAGWADGVEAMAGLYDELPRLDVAVVDSAPFALEGEEADAAASARESANLVIWTVPDDAVQGFISAARLPPEAAAELSAPRDGCAVAGARSAVLSNVAIVLRDDLSAARRRTCLGESLAMALGFYVPEKYVPDVFRERQGTIAFHPLGRMAAALVYDPALEPGTPRADGLDAAAEILKSKGLD